MNTLLIGDVHGKFKDYKRKIRAFESEHPEGHSIQLGDFGFRTQHQSMRHGSIDTNKHKVLFGNHDDYRFVGSRHSLGNFGMTRENIFYIRGAYSIDKVHRIEGKSWWPEEELNYSQFLAAYDEYTKIKPRFVISHDAPSRVVHELFGIHTVNYGHHSQTQNSLQHFFEAHQPEVWVFGHHHISVTKEINGTIFKCLAELETFYLNHS